MAPRIQLRDNSDGAAFTLTVGPNYELIVNNADGTVPLSQIGVNARQTVVIYGEENGGIAANQNEYSYGNGAVGFIGVTVLGDWELFGVSVDIEQFNGAGPTLAVMDFTAGNANTVLHQFTAATSNHTEELTTPVAVSNGTVLGFRTVNLNGGTFTDVRIAAWLQR